MDIEIKDEDIQPYLKSLSALNKSEPFTQYRHGMELMPKQDQIDYIRAVISLGKIHICDNNNDNKVLKTDCGRVIHDRDNSDGYKHELGKIYYVTDETDRIKKLKENIERNTMHININVYVGSYDDYDRFANLTSVNDACNKNDCHALDILKGNYDDKTRYNDSNIWRYTVELTDEELAELADKTDTAKELLDRFGAARSAMNEDAPPRELKNSYGNPIYTKDSEELRIGDMYYCTDILDIADEGRSANTSVFVGLYNGRATFVQLDILYKDYLSDNNILDDMLRGYYNNRHDFEKSLLWKYLTPLTTTELDEMRTLSDDNGSLLRAIENARAKIEGDNMPEAPPVTPAPVTPAPVTPAAPQDAFNMMLDGMIGTKIEEVAKRDISAEKIDAMITNQLKGHSKTVTFKRYDGGEFKPDVTPHQSFEEMMHWISLGENVMLTGPAGSGKTSSGKMAADVLGVEFGSLSLSNDTRAYALFGFTNGTIYTSTEFRRLYEHGGVFILDEVDNGQANVLSKLNSALEQGYYSFDDKVVQKHDSFVCISTANTWGNGADRQYVGRNALDAAFLDRFIKIDWGYDEKLELAISSNDKFTKKVQLLRKASQELGIKVIISPRTSIRGGKMLDAKITGMTEKKILEATIWRGVSDSVKKKIVKKYNELKKGN